MSKFTDFRFRLANTSISKSLLEMIEIESTARGSKSAFIYECIIVYINSAPFIGPDNNDEVMQLTERNMDGHENGIPPIKVRIPHTTQGYIISEYLNKLSQTNKRCFFIKAILHYQSKLSQFENWMSNGFYVNPTFMPSHNNTSSNQSLNDLNSNDKKNGNSSKKNTSTSSNIDILSTAKKKQNTIDIKNENENENLEEDSNNNKKPKKFDAPILF